VAVAVLLLLAPVTIGPALVLLDLLVRREYEAHRDAWVRDGRPVGCIWHPPEEDGLGRLARAGWSVAQWRVVVWLVRTPRWATADPKAVRLLRTLRTLVVVWNAAVVVVYLYQ
jgi:hypothetical protein